jgi:DNA-binding response OmpR family regulator
MEAHSVEEPVVLVVSNQPGFAGIVDRALSDRLVMVSASDVPRARQACADSLPHAIVFDVPERQSVALEVLQELRDEFRTLPILLLSWEHALRAPVTDLEILPKPFELSALRAALERIFS